MEKKTIISLIAAVTPGGVIGEGNSIPWKIREDLLLFKRITLNHPVIMGRKTFQSLPGPLKERRNLVISRSWSRLPGDETSPNADLCSSLKEALEAAGTVREGIDATEVFIIGGAQIYRQALPLADRLYISRIHREYSGDTFFPKIPPEDWHLSQTRPYEEFTLEIYDRNR